MNVAERILKEMETPEGKAKLDKWVEEYWAKEKVKNEKIKKLMANKDYLIWLDQFTQDKDEFYDDDWLYCPEKIKDSDKENVEKLCLLYEGINNYSQQNHIYPEPCEFGNFYKIKLDEKGFEIGTLIGQNVIFFCKKVSIVNEQEFIDFNDIMTGKKSEQVDQINAKLDSLAKMVKAIYESGVPIESINYTLENTLKELISQNENKTKSLIRK